MSEPKLIFKVELIDNNLRVTLGTGHEALLSLGLRKAGLYIDEVLIGNEMKQAEADKPSIITDVPESLLKTL